MQTRKKATPTQSDTEGPEGIEKIAEKTHSPRSRSSLAQIARERKTKFGSPFHQEQVSSDGAVSSDGSVFGDLSRSKKLRYDVQKIQFGQQNPHFVHRNSRAKWAHKKGEYLRHREDKIAAEHTFQPQLETRNKYSPEPSPINRASRIEGLFSPKMSQHEAERIDRLREERLNKEMEQCTFCPEINTDLNKAILRGRPKRFIDGLEEQNEERKRRIEEIEADAYRELTLKPVISQYAMKHGGGHSHRNPDDAVKCRTVYDRLYRAYTVTHTRKSARYRGPSYGQVPDDILRSLKKNKTARRATPTTDLLYSDALDRRQRQIERMQLDQQMMDPVNCQQF